MDSPESVPPQDGEPLLLTEQQQERTKQVYFDIVHAVSPQEQFFQALLDGRVTFEPERPASVPATDWPEAKHVAYRVVVDPADAGA